MGPLRNIGDKFDPIFTLADDDYISDVTDSWVSPYCSWSLHAKLTKDMELFDCAIGRSGSSSTLSRDATMHYYENTGTIGSPTFHRYKATDSKTVLRSICFCLT